jgi:uncharacterized protein
MQKQGVRRKLSSRLLIGVGILAILFLLITLLSFIGRNELVDFWWFDALGYQFFYWQRTLYQYVVFAAVTLFFFLLFFVNFWIASRFLKSAPPRNPYPEDPHHGTQQEPASKPQGRVYKAFQAGSFKLFVPLSLILSIVLALPLYRSWEQVLFFLFGPRMGVADTFFGHDVSFYLFNYPIYIILQRALLIVSLVLLVGLFLLYLLKNRASSGRLFAFGWAAKWHLTTLMLCAVAMFGWGLWLQIFGLLYGTTHEPLFYGPGYVQMKVIIPIKYATLFILAATTLVLLHVLHRQRGYKLLAVMVVLLALSGAAMVFPFIPRAVESFRVTPNQIEMESQYITRHIAATLDAYGLNDVETREFRPQVLAGKAVTEQIRDILRNIPVWDADVLMEVFEQRQELRAYYTFPLISVGRHTVAGNYQQVFVAPREIDYDNLPSDAQRWINQHLIYTHGHSVVMTPASQDSGAAMTWFLHNIPAESRYGLEIEQPRIYYGIKKDPYVIAPNRIGEMDYPLGNTNVTSNYTGKGGVPISSLFRKFVVANYMGDRDLFFSSDITKHSKILFRRSVVDRVSHIAPFLELDQTPYVAVTSKGIYWVIDAYTTSSWYPASAPYTLGTKTVNYIRNSIKIVVDAYHGSVDFYIFDENDPIARAYSRIYPGFFKDKASMPDELMAHMRYPKDMFDIQMQAYAKYHQTDPYVFYQQEDLWTFAETIVDGIPVRLKPYFMTLDLIDPGRLDFMLLQPMFPRRRDNLRSLGVVGCDAPNYGKIIIYNFPKGVLSHGPAQINALINQHPDIAQQFSLWDQAGSSVVRGNMIIFPMEDSILFIQPVYLKSTTRVAIPELQRIIMSEGNFVVMERTLEEAYEVLRKRLEAEEAALEQRYPTRAVDTTQQE